MAGEERVKIALDAMGGDNAPDVIVEAAVDAEKEIDAELILVGDEERLKGILRKYGKKKIRVYHAPQVIGEDEKGANAVRIKPHSSIVEAMKMLKRKEAHALVSAGNTGALMSAALMYLGKIKGVQRPAIAIKIPTLKGGCLILDVGANVDCKPVHLYKFALMGEAYAEYMLGVHRPNVGILNIGAERTKGNELVLKAWELFERSSFNFVGNVEGRDILDGKVDVVVCDGFVGNVLLKFGEGLVNFICKNIKESFKKNMFTKIASLLLRKSIEERMKSLDYTEYGGTPLLGVKGICIICHGSSNAKAIKNAIKVALNAEKTHLVEKMEERLRCQMQE